MTVSHEIRDRDCDQAAEDPKLVDRAMRFERALRRRNRILNIAEHLGRLGDGIASQASTIGGVVRQREKFEAALVETGLLSFQPAEQPQVDLIAQGIRLSLYEKEHGRTLEESMQRVRESHGPGYGQL